MNNTKRDLFQELMQKYERLGIPSYTKKEAIQDTMKEVSKLLMRGGKMVGGAADKLICLQDAAINNNFVYEMMMEASDRILMEKVVDKAIQGEDKSGETTAEEVMKEIDSLLDMAVDLGAVFSPIVKGRMPKQYLMKNKDSKRKLAIFSKDTPLGQVSEMIEKLIDNMDVKVLGEGSAKSGERVPGIIDSIKVDTDPFVIYIKDIPKSFSRDISNALFTYKRNVAILMDETKALKVVERTEARAEVNEYRMELIEYFNELNDNEKKLCVAKWAVITYDSDSYMHDSHLYIEDMIVDGRIVEGTFKYFLEVLQDVGLAKRSIVDPNVKAFRELMGLDPKKAEYTQNIDYSEVKRDLYIWRSSREGSVKAEQFQQEQEVLIENKKALIGDILFNINTKKSPIKDGIYVIKNIVPWTDKEGEIITTGILLRVLEQEA